MLLDLIRDCLASALNLDPAEREAIAAGSTATDLEKWDSLGHLRLVLELERRLDLEFDDDEIVELGSVEAIIHAVERRRR